jgi:hypothetical protein
MEEKCGEVYENHQKKAERIVRQIQDMYAQFNKTLQYMSEIGTYIRFFGLNIAQNLSFTQ